MTAAKTECDQVERVADYVLQVLSAPERSALEGHLDGCAECRRELESLRFAVDALADWPTDVLRPPAPLWDRLVRRVGADAGGDPPRGSEDRWVGGPEWKQVADGISCKLLSVDAARAYVSMLVRLAPGVAYPPHVHAGIEELYLLDGELWIGDAKLAPGDYHRAEPGTSDHRVWSETGCTCVLLTSSDDLLI